MVHTGNGIGVRDCIRPGKSLEDYAGLELTLRTIWILDKALDQVWYRWQDCHDCDGDDYMGVNTIKCANCTNPEQEWHSFFSVQTVRFCSFFRHRRNCVTPARAQNCWGQHVTALRFFGFSFMLIPYKT